jgi:hypothetical protein
MYPDLPRSVSWKFHKEMAKARMEYLRYLDDQAGGFRHCVKQNETVM